MRSEQELYNLVEAIDIINKGIIEFSSVNIPDKYTSDLKKAINVFFPDYTCTAVSISNNTDKEFFGAYINKNIDINMILTEPDIREMRDCNDNYTIDIDSKLFNIGLTSYQIASLLIYDLYKMLTVETTINVSQTIDYICANRKTVIRKKTLGERVYERLLKICSLDYIYRTYSIFTRKADELIRIPELLTSCRMDEGFDETCTKLFKYTNAGGRLTVNPALCLNWAIAVVCSHKPHDEDILEVLNDYNTSTGSDMIKGLTNALAYDIKKLNMDNIRNVANFIKEASLFTKIRKNGLKSLENDVFEYEMRVKNIEDENSAIFLMRQINSRMSIIQDYLEEENLSESERRRWETLYYKYERIRIKMTSKPIYSKKMYGLYTDYNALMQPGAENIMTMQTIY